MGHRAAAAGAGSCARDRAGRLQRRLADSGNQAAAAALCRVPAGRAAGGTAGLAAALAGRRIRRREHSPDDLRPAQPQLRAHTAWGRDCLLHDHGPVLDQGPGGDHRLADRRRHQVADAARPHRALRLLRRGAAVGGGGRARHPQPHPPRLPAGSRDPGRAGRGRTRPAGRAGRRRGADQDRPGTARRGGASRQPHGGPVRGRGRVAARPARRGGQGRGDHRPDGPGGADRAAPPARRAARPGRCQRPGGYLTSPVDQRARRGDRSGAPGRDRREPARRGQPQQAAAGRGPDRVPDRAGGADQYGQAFRRGRGRGDRQLPAP